MGLWKVILPPFYIFVGHGYLNNYGSGYCKRRENVFYYSLVRSWAQELNNRVFGERWFP